MKRFCITGSCVPDKDYMADVSGKIAQIMPMVERGDYFTINRARQYGKTTILWLLDGELVKKGYAVAHLSFEGLGDTPFENENNFCRSFVEQIYDEMKRRNISSYKLWKNDSITTIKKLDKFLSAVCKNQKLVLIIDETDKESNNTLFLRFIGMLRDKYLLCKNKVGATFHSVLLAGVYDIKNLKVKLIQSGNYKLQGGEKRVNSPWNIAAKFNVDMSLSAKEIESMLLDYDREHDDEIGEKRESIAQEIRNYTSGYPYLVSNICKTIDEELDKDWSLGGVQKAVKSILTEQSTLFDDLFKNIESDDNLNDLLKRSILYGEEIHYNADNPAMKTAEMFNIIAKKGDTAAVSNKIFEIRLYNYYISLKETSNNAIPRTISNYIIENGKFNMPLALKRFCEHYHELYHKSREAFLENECRLLFLTYLKPLINGQGFYHIETETRNRERMDVIVDWGEQQFIVELKIWRGGLSHSKAQKQLTEYLNSKNKTEGYLLTFDFRKRRAKKPAFKWIRKDKKKFYDCLAV